MTQVLRVMVESGKKKVVAVAFDWIGWERSGTSEADALRVLADYRRRYDRVAELAGLAPDFHAAVEPEVVERIEGTSTTDFYGISTRSVSTEYAPMTEAECERKIRLLRACWAYFDETALRVSAEMRKGPRGGGRDRDQIVRHTLGSEGWEMAKKVHMKTPPAEVLNPDGLRAYRERYCDALRDYNARGAPALSWTVQFTIRRSAYHMLDHAWEMEDKDLSRAGQ